MSTRSTEARAASGRFTEQEAGLDAQLTELKALKCRRVFKEQVSSVDIVRRVQLEAAIEFLREGDVLVVTKLDRLARSIRDLVAIIDRIEAKGAALRILGMGLDTSTPNGRLMLNVLGSVAQFEREIMLERQRVGSRRPRRKANTRGANRRHAPRPTRSRRCWRAAWAPSPSPASSGSAAARSTGSWRARSYRIVRFRRK